MHILTLSLLLAGSSASGPYTYITPTQEIPHIGYYTQEGHIDIVDTWTRQGSVMMSSNINSTYTFRIGTFDTNNEWDEIYKYEEVISYVNLVMYSSFSVHMQAPLSIIQALNFSTRPVVVRRSLEIPASSGGSFPQMSIQTTFNWEALTPEIIETYGYERGLQEGRSEGYVEGEEAGYQNGYTVGRQEGQAYVSEVGNFWTNLWNGVDRIMSCEIFPGFRLWYVVGAPLLLGLLGFVVGFFR